MGWLCEMTGIHPVQILRPMAHAAPNGVGRLVLRDGVEPRAKVRRVSQPRIGTQRREERLLEAILRFAGAYRGDQESMQLRGVRVDQ